MTIEQFKCDPFKLDTLELTVARLVCSCFVAPHAIANKRAFQVLFSKAFSSKISEYQIWKMIEGVKASIDRKIVSSIEQQLPAVTCDDWGSCNGRNYCNINLYIKSLSDDIVRYSLGLIEVEDTSGCNLSDKISTHLNKYKVKPLFITTDGAANMEKMTKYSKFIQQKCFLHAINLLVVDLLYKKDCLFENSSEYENDESTGEINNDSDEEYKVLDDKQSKESDNGVANLEISGLQKYPETFEMERPYSLIINEIRCLMKYLKKSKKSRYLLRKYSDLAPVVDCPTRWSSLCLMLQRFLELYPSIRKASIDSNKILQYSVNLGEIARNQISKLLEVLIPIKEAVTKLSSEDNNLLSADIILSDCYKKLLIVKARVAANFFERINLRRTIYTDILAFLLNQTSSVFYKEPDTDKIIILNDLVLRD